MRSIKISDSLGLDLDIPVQSPLKKYLRHDVVDLLAMGDLKNEVTKTLGESGLKPAGLGLNIERSVEFGSGETELTVEAGVNGGIAIHKQDTQLFTGDLIGDDVTIPVGQAFVETSFSARVAPDISHGGGDITFGFESNSEVKLQSFRAFPASQTVREAFSTTLGEFSIPGDFSDLQQLPEHTISSLSGSGTLTLQVEAELRTVPNPLAVPGLPPAIPEIALKPGASIGATASFRIGGAYEIRVRKLSSTTVRLGYYKKDESEFTVGVEAKAGVSFGIGRSDFIGSILTAISGNPKADAEELERAGLSTEHIEEIQNAIRRGVERSVEAGLNVELSALRAGEAAFLYDIDLNIAGGSDRARRGINKALDGDLSLLTEAEQPGALDGVTLLRSVWKASRERGLTLRLNLLGILNAASLSKLLVEGTVVTDHLTGEVTITDQVTGKRLRALMVNFGQNQEKIRRVFFEAMIATVAYRASDVLKDIEVTSSHTYFELHQKTNTQAMKDNLDAVEAVGLLNDAARQNALAHGEPFGRSILVLEASYDDEQCRRIFFGTDNKPRSETYYEQAARKALSALVRPGDPNEQRRIPAFDDALWEQLKANGSPSGNMAILRARLGAGTPISLLAAMDGDFAFIATFWAPSLHKTAKKLAEVRDFLAEHPNTRPDDHDFQKLRKELANHLRNVAKDTKERFGDPLGLVALYFAAGATGSVRAKLSCHSFSLSLPKVVEAGSAQS